jgi:lysophospholipase L1-like esterase
MKLRSAALLLVLLATMSTTNQKKTRIVFFGDSITQAGAKPGGYIMRISDSLEKRGLSSQYELVGAGISGNKIYDLYLRMDDDVLAKSPDIVFIWIGVNDVWHKASSGTGTDIAKFGNFYEAIIKKLQAKNIQVVLATPAAIGERTDYTNQQDGDLNLYSRVIRDLAKKYNCKLVDLRKAFLDYNLKNNPENKESGILTTDRVHLNDKGNQFVADNVWSVVIAR